jgi:hypothetical protein
VPFCSKLITGAMLLSLRRRPHGEARRFLQEYMRYAPWPDWISPLAPTNDLFVCFCAAVGDKRTRYVRPRSFVESDPQGDPRYERCAASV